MHVLVLIQESRALKQDLIARGAIFEDAPPPPPPGEVLVPV